MGTNVLRAAGGMRGWALFVALIAMVAVPPLVLAMPHHQGSAPRLTRGFEPPPPAKCSIAPVTPAACPHQIQPPSPSHRFVEDLPNDSTPLVSSLRDSTPRRGPPAFA